MFTYPYPWSIMSSATSVTVSVDVQILEALGLEPTQEQALCLEPTRERALGSIMGSKTSHIKRWVFPEAPVWRTAGLKEPRTAGLREPLTVVGMTSEPLTAGLSEPRMAAGLTSPRRAWVSREWRRAWLSEPRTFGLASPWTAVWRELQLAGLFWIGEGHSPDTGGYLPSSWVRWCLGLEVFTGPVRVRVYI